MLCSVVWTATLGQDGTSLAMGERDQHYGLCHMTHVAYTVHVHVPTSPRTALYTHTLTGTSVPSIHVHLYVSLDSVPGEYAYIYLVLVNAE